MSAFALNPKRIGGTEMYARELSLQLGWQGCRSVLCFASPPTERVREFLSLPNVSIESLEDFGGSSFASLSAFARVIRKYRPEILHLQYTAPVSLLPWVARLNSVRSIFFTDHYSRFEGFERRQMPQWKQRIARAVNAPVTRVIGVSDSNAAVFAASGVIGSGKVVRIYNGVDLTRPVGDGASFRRRYGIPAGRRIVLQVSWMIPEKGVDDLLAAAKIVLSQEPDVHFAVVGEGSSLEEYRARAQADGMADRFTWTGQIDDPLTEGVYEAADVFCQLSRWNEAFGWTYAEAMTARKPVVAARVGGVPEVVEDGVSGFLVDRRSPEQAAERLLMLLRQPELGRRMGAAGRRVVEQKFDLRRNVSEMLSLYGMETHSTRVAAAAVAV